MHPDLLIFFGISFIPVMLLVRYRRVRGMDRGIIFLLIGTGILSVAAFVDYLEETSLHPYMLRMASKQSWDMLIAVFGYIPGVFIAGLGLSRWFHVALRLENEIKKREKAEASLRERTNQLKEALAVAEEANRAKTEFLAKMSHELRTPLNAIIGFSEIMNMQLFGKFGEERYAEYSSFIYDSGTLLLQIINDILDLAKVEAGRLELEEEAFFLRGVIAECLPVVKNHAANTGVTIHPETEDDLVLWADRRIVKQMILNLLSNAIKFTPAKGQIYIRSFAGTDGSHVLEVKDTGIGMTEAELKVALQPFGQVEGVLTRNHSGTGLGLALVNTFMGLHDGKIEILSAKGDGTSARLVFSEARVVKPAETGAETNIKSNSVPA